MKSYRRLLKFLIGGIVAVVIIVAIVGYVISIYWPCHDFGWSVPSPDSKYVVVVLRGDAAAFDDFYYDVYLLPQSDAPRGMKEGDFVPMLGKWRSNRYLVFSGYSYPVIHWKSSRKIEITVDDFHDGANVSVWSFDPVKRLVGNETVVASLVFDKFDPRKNDIP